MGEPSHADETGSEVIHCTADAGMRNSLSPGAAFSSFVFQLFPDMHSRKESDHDCGQKVIRMME